MIEKPDHKRGGRRVSAARAIRTGVEFNTRRRRRAGARGSKGVFRRSRRKFSREKKGRVLRGAYYCRTYSLRARGERGGGKMVRKKKERRRKKKHVSRNTGSRKEYRLVCRVKAPPTLRYQNAPSDPAPTLGTSSPSTPLGSHLNPSGPVPFSKKQTASAQKVT